jgi:heat shock protein HslJ
VARLLIEGVDWIAGDASLRLEGGRVSGSGGVNRLLGDYRLEGSRLIFGPVATTMMAGPQERMESEQRFLAALARVTQWSRDGEQLVLRDEGGNELLRIDTGRPAPDGMQAPEGR